MDEGEQKRIKLRWWLFSGDTMLSRDMVGGTFHNCSMRHRDKKGREKHGSRLTQGIP